ncbi:hypothetical protein BGW36DRAFT_356898 [Talaromyces proteolyticus]|uniref:Uncharacterized protein n=1 Tax=Talaromyces proteolyticus TaxID=1131652 RepID=A0AAD4PXM7_9EURO|nr:uncharacterized protein BGW36DRAFT_356898 [Talaromyces proteolyticus]KAH8700235.1 hypothetical protein BGW36DRAFT_356898 [Talaromyces proteolyticus]
MVYNLLAEKICCLRYPTSRNARSVGGKRLRITLTFERVFSLLEFDDDDDDDDKWDGLSTDDELSSDSIVSESGEWDNQGSDEEWNLEGNDEEYANADAESKCDPMITGDDTELAGSGDYDPMTNDEDAERVIEE